MNHPGVPVEFIVVIALILLAFAYSRLVTIPAAIRRWADGEGYRVLRRELVSRSEHRGYVTRARYQVLTYRVVLWDAAGTTREALIRISPPLLLPLFWWWPDRFEVQPRWMGMPQPSPNVPLIEAPTHDIQ